MQMSSAPIAATATQALSHLLQYRSLFDAGRALAFPCDPQGQVDLNALSDKARNNYLFARAVVGREYALPAVVPCH